MARRRPAGEGSVFRHNGAWAGQLDVHEWNQPRRRKTVYGPTQALVLNKLDDLRQQVQLGSAVPTGRAVTVGAYLEEWLTVTLPGQVLAGRLKRSTLASYTDQTRRHILPTLGNTPLVELSPRQLRAWLGKAHRDQCPWSPPVGPHRRLPPRHPAGRSGTGRPRRTAHP